MGSREELRAQMVASFKDAIRDHLRRCSGELRRGADAIDADIGETQNVARNLRDTVIALRTATHNAMVSVEAAARYMVDVLDLLEGDE